MADAKHTPGPWTYSTHSDGWSYTIHIAQADDAAYTPDWSDVAYFTPCRGERQQIQEANARLIAAAPELLEALQAVMAKCACLEFGDRSAFIAAEAAIAKSTGSAS